jgi:DNA-binding HxlR family transcriptional regulator
LSEDCNILIDLMRTCPVDNTFTLIGKKFTIHILRNMTKFDQTKFNQFINSIEGISPKTLSVRLDELEKNGLVKKRIIPGTSPVIHEYILTEKGDAIRTVIDQMAAFSMKYYAKEVFKDGKPRTFKQVFKEPPESFD